MKLDRPIALLEKTHNLIHRIYWDCDNLQDIKDNLSALNSEIQEFLSYYEKLREDGYIND